VLDRGRDGRRLDDDDDDDDENDAFPPFRRRPIFADKKRPRTHEEKKDADVSRLSMQFPRCCCCCCCCTTWVFNRSTRFNALSSDAFMTETTRFFFFFFFFETCKKALPFVKRFASPKMFCFEGFSGIF
jgi:hypothetical protein